MLITVLWEDQRGGVKPKSYGPDQLLKACVADETGLDREVLNGRISANPCKGVGNIKRALTRDLDRLTKRGPVIAVADFDRFHDLWRGDPSPPGRCMSAMSARFKSDVPGDYELLFLVENVESLINTVLGVLGREQLETKPTPDQRDRYLQRITYSGSPDQRKNVCNRCPSFGRLVDKVVHLVR